MRLLQTLAGARWWRRGVRGEFGREYRSSRAERSPMGRIAISPPRIYKFSRSTVPWTSGSCFFTWDKRCPD